MRRATIFGEINTRGRDFLSTLSLRRATRRASRQQPAGEFSIHALLAESDSWPRRMILSCLFFYPRSPCGERREVIAEMTEAQSFSIHALLAESDTISSHPQRGDLHFLSTLSLRRATSSVNVSASRLTFLSTLSLRRATQDIANGER